MKAVITRMGDRPNSIINGIIILNIDNSHPDYLTLNTTKTKEMVIDFCRKGTDHENVIIHDEAIEQVGKL